MARKKPHNIKASGIPERIARTDAKGKQTKLETRLGRLMLKVPPFTNILHGTDINRPNDWMIITTGGRIMGQADNLLDALLAAGITDD